MQYSTNLIALLGLGYVLGSWPGALAKPMKKAGDFLQYEPTFLEASDLRDDSSSWMPAQPKDGHAKKNVTMTEAKEPKVSLPAKPKAADAPNAAAKEAKPLVQQQAKPANFLQLLETTESSSEAEGPGHDLQSGAPILALTQYPGAIQEHVKDIMAYNPSKCLDSCTPGGDASYSACVQACEKIAMQ